MPREKQNTGKGKKPSPDHQEVQCASVRPTEDEDSESEFAAVEKSLEQSLTHDSLTWMRHVIRVQAAEVTKGILKQEREAKSTSESYRIDMLNKQIDDLKKKLCDTQQDVDSLKAENIRRKREIERLEFTNSKKQSMIDDLKVKLDEMQQDKGSVEGHVSN